LGAPKVVILLAQPGHHTLCLLSACQRDEARLDTMQLSGLLAHIIKEEKNARMFIDIGGRALSSSLTG